MIADAVSTPYQAIVRSGLSAGDVAVWVGAGGIGLQLQASLNVLAWPQVTVILLVIFATVLLSEWVSARIRHAII